MAVETICDFAEPAAQCVDRDQRRADIGNRPGCRCVIRDGRSPRLDRLSCVVEPVAAFAATGKKQESLADIARIARDAADRNVGRLGEAF